MMAEAVNSLIAEETLDTLDVCLNRLVHEWMRVPVHSSIGSLRVLGLIVEGRLASAALDYLTKKAESDDKPF